MGLKKDCIQEIEDSISAIPEGHDRVEDQGPYEYYFQSVAWDRGPEQINLAFRERPSRDSILGETVHLEINTDENTGNLEKLRYIMSDVSPHRSKGPIGYKTKERRYEGSLQTISRRGLKKIARSLKAAALLIERNQAGKTQTVPESKMSPILEGARLAYPSPERTAKL